MQKHTDTKGHAHRHTQCTETDRNQTRQNPYSQRVGRLKKRKDTRAQEAWVFLYKILENNYRCTRGKDLHALWITVLTVIKLS